jgi:hypothetical protein
VLHNSNARSGLTSKNKYTKPKSFILYLVPGQPSRYSDGLWAGQLGFDSQQVQIFTLLHSV